MSLSPRQLATVVFVGVCMLAAAAVCLFAPLRFAILAVLFAVGGCVLVILVFLRKVLSSIYQLRDAINNGEVALQLSAKSPADVTERLDRIERHMPERITARVIFELAQRDPQLLDPAGSDSSER
ncbi:hypothetical protein G7066_13325 [Leucobacter coleopterorum]|uniref:Uncharacterized protein n=1 Tax=Leucobacter coleopterorum TaxID=2714933 RepID=A0ABX6K2F0_9MICO|nr:hypothetical protein [Leucobacter coleopterorum]QIM19304.1 hypothetical protein G7066_13325 [Leucobacter coleopterorum]